MPEYASKPPMRRSPDLPYVVALLAVFAAPRALVYAHWLAVRERRPELGRWNGEALV